MCFMVFTLPWEEVILQDLPISVPKLAGVAAMGFGLLPIFFRVKIRKLPAFFLCTFLFFLWAFASYFWCLNQSYCIEKVITLVQLILFAWIIWEYTPSENEQELLMTAYIAGAMIAAIGIINNSLAGTSMAGSGGARSGLQGSDENDLSLIIALGVPLAWSMVLKNKDNIKMWPYLIFILTVSLAILLTGSRGGLLVLLASLTYVAATTNKMPKNFQIVLICMVIFVGPPAVVKVVPPATLKRLGTVVKELKGGSMSNRRKIWDAGLRYFNNSPFLGAGFNCYKEVVYQYLGYKIVAHNTFLSVMVELGIPGLILFLIMLGSNFVSIMKQKFVKRMMWLAIYMAWGLGVSSLTWETIKATWFVFGFCCASCNSDERLAFIKFRISGDFKKKDKNLPGDGKTGVITEPQEIEPKLIEDKTTEK